MAVNTDSDDTAHAIFLSDTLLRRVLKLTPNGQLVDEFDTSGVGFVQPGGLVLRPLVADMFVADWGVTGRGYSKEVGSVLHIDARTGELLSVINTTIPRLFRPLSLALDTNNNILYVADSNGHIFQFNLWDIPNYPQAAVHTPVPVATTIASMTINAKGGLYMVDVFSHRIISLMWDAAAVYNPGSDCVPPGSRSLSSSSSSSAASSSSSTVTVWSSSSTASAPPVHPALWSATVVVSLAVLGVAAVAAGSVCFYTRWRRGQGRRSRSSKELDERLIDAVEQKEYEEEGEENEEEEEEHNDVVDSSVWWAVTVDESPHVAKEAAIEQHAPIAPSDELSPPSNAVIDQRGRRYEYYIFRYEVVAAVREMEQADKLGQQQAYRSVGQQLSIQIPQSTLSLPRASTSSTHVSPAPTTASPAQSYSSYSANSDSSSASHSSSSSSTSNDYVQPSMTRSTNAAVTSRAASAALSAMTSPPHIAELQSSWRTTPTFISSVTDLTILGEGSSGVVYRGMYRGQACVVKLPKSVALTGAAWREWQCHLGVPPHPNLVRFLGALPMSSSNYLVTAFVRQGSLHSLLTSDTPSSAWYHRPYGVMRCLRDMSAALHHIHTAGIVHRDVSCRNILVDSDGVMVLADLGLATLMTETDESTLQTAVPVRWTSPESLATCQYSSKSDVWSLGVALWEMTAGGALPYGEQQRNTKACIRPIIEQHMQLRVDEGWGNDDTTSEAEQKLAVTVRQLVQLCLLCDVEQRPDSEQLVAAVERGWEAWRAAAGSEAELLESEWQEYHSEVQQRLGAPAERYTIDACHS